MDSFVPTLLIDIIYLYFVMKLGPKLMANREPCKIDLILTIYNLVQIVSNAYIFWLVFDQN